MLGNEDWTSETSTSASCLEEPAAGSRLKPPQQQQKEQILRNVQQRGPVSLPVWQQQQQQRGRAQEEHFLDVQDEQLNVLETTVGNLRNIGLQIGEELDGHQQLLGELDEQVERTRGALNQNMLLLQKVVDRQSTTCLCLTAVMLFLTLLVLLFLVY